MQGKKRSRKRSKRHVLSDDDDSNSDWHIGPCKISNESKDLEEYIATNKNKIASNYHSESSKFTKLKFVTKQTNKLHK